MKTVQFKTLLVFTSLISLAAAAADTPVEKPENLPVTKEVFWYRSEATQGPVAAVSDIGELARQNALVIDTGAAFGFAAGSVDAQYFLAGAAYSEALALTRGGDYAEAAKRLDTLGEALIVFEAPGSLYHYLQRVRYLISSGTYDRKVLVEMLSLFQPLFEDYARAQSADMLTLVQAGAWLVDMSLALSAGDSGMLKDSLVLSHMSSEMKRMEAPEGVLSTLAEIETIGRQEALSERDMQHVIQLVKKLQQMLS
jgi:hypothetical protein